MGDTPRMPESDSVPRRLLLAGAIGSILEWYDFSVFGVFAVVLARVFFASDDEITALLSTFAVFGVGFLARPIGAFAFGAYGDRLGRRRALLLTILLMAVPTTLMAFLPTPASIGVTATVLLIALRFVQGLSAGGEVAGGYTFLSEQGRPGHYARAVNWGAWVTFLGLALGAAVGATMTSMFPMSWVETWGWRIAFGLNLVLLAIAYTLRRGLVETPEFEQLRASGATARNPVREAFATAPRQLVAGFLASSYSSAAIYFVATFMPAFLAMEDMLSITQALLLTLLNVAAIVVCCFLGARLADQFGARRVAATTAGAMIVVALPLWWLATRHEAALIVAGSLALSALLALYYVAQLTMVNRSFPTRVRYAGHSIAHNLASAVFGGSSALVATFLLKTTGNVLAPISLVLLTSVIALASMWLYPRLYEGER